MGLYLERPAEGIPLRELCGTILHREGFSDFAALRYCDDSGGGLRRYHVYKVTADGRDYALKRSEEREVRVYERFLSGRGFRVPRYYGSAVHSGRPWILLEHVPGPDLRDFTDELARAAADSVSAVMNAYWESGTEDGRFAAYWERINRRARCLAGEPALERAYGRFLERQLTCPRTLCSGDCLPCNAIDRGGEVCLIDWAFAGMMPYALDAARMVAHGTEDRRTFPFRMTREQKGIYLRTLYGRLERKPDWERYLLDIRLAALNEYVEFIEYELNHPEAERDRVFDFYYAAARALAAELA